MTAARQDAALALVVEPEAAELDVGRLVRRVDLEDAEVVRLVVVRLDVVGQVDRRPLRGGTALAHPADAAALEAGDGPDGDVGAGQGLAVKAKELADVLQVDAGGERLDHLLGLAGLEAEVGLAALAALAQDREAGGVPLLDVVKLEAAAHGGRHFERRHGRRWRVGDEGAGELDEAAVIGRSNVLEGDGGLGEEGVGLPAEAARDASRELEIGAALGRVDVAQELGTTLEVEAGLGPGGVGDGAAKSRKARRSACSRLAKTPVEASRQAVARSAERSATPSRMRTKRPISGKERLSSSAGVRAKNSLVSDIDFQVPL